MQKGSSAVNWRDLFHLCMSLELIIAVLYIFLAHQMMHADISWGIPLFWVLLAIISFCFIASAITNPSQLSEFIRFHQVFQIILPFILFYSIQPEMESASPQLLPEAMRSPYIIISFLIVRLALIIIALLCQAQMKKYSELREEQILEKNCP